MWWYAIIFFYVIPSIICVLIDVYNIKRLTKDNEGIKIHSSWVKNVFIADFVPIFNIFTIYLFIVDKITMKIIEKL